MKDRPLALGSTAARTDPRADAPAWRSLLASRTAEIALVAALCLLGLALRYPYTWLEPRLTDEWRMSEYALGIIRGEFFPLVDVSPYIGSLWDYLVAAGYLTLGTDPRTPRVLPLVFGALTVPAAYLLGREVRGRAAGLASGLLMLTSPIHVIAISHVAWSHMLTPFFTTLGLWLLAGAVRRGSGRWLAWSGLAFGVAFQTHPTAAVLLPGAVLYLWLRRRSLLLSRWAAFAAALFVIGCLNLLVASAADPGRFLGSVTERQDQYQERNAPDTGFGERYLTNAGQLGLMLGRLPSGAALDDNEADSVLLHPIVWVFVLALGAGLVVATLQGVWLPLAVLAPAVVLLPFFQPSTYFPVPDGRFAMPLIPPLYAALGAALVGVGAWLPRLAPRGLAPLVARHGAGLGLLGAAGLALLALRSVVVFYVGDGERLATYGAIWDAAMRVYETAPPDTRVVLDDALREDFSAHAETQRGLLASLRIGGLRPEYVAFDPAQPGAALTDRRAYYLLGCEAYQTAGVRSGLVPLDGGREKCRVVQAARYP